MDKQGSFLKSYVSPGAWGVVWAMTLARDRPHLQSPGVLLDDTPALTLLPGFPGAELDRGTIAAPVTWDRLWVDGDQHVMPLCQPLQEVPADPQLVPHIQTAAWAYGIGPLP